jgi:hypothetical protein
MICHRCGKYCSPDKIHGTIFVDKILVIASVPVVSNVPVVSSILVVTIYLEF